MPAFILLIAGKNAQGADINFSTLYKSVCSANFFNAEVLVSNSLSVSTNERGKEITPAHMSGGYNYV